MRQRQALSSGMVLCLVVLTCAVFLHACQDQQAQPTELTAASVSATQTLTIQGFGSGDGVVTVPASGAIPALNCTIRTGQAAATGCTQDYPTGTIVTLTAIPAEGFGFSSWGGGCSGSGSCQKTLNISRTVKAAFSHLNLLTVTGAGTGDGTVASQPTLSPSIECTITAGAAAVAGCTASYSSTTIVTLTAVPMAGSVFTTWGAGCSGTGLCQKTMNIARTIKATFKKTPFYTVTVTSAGTGDGVVTSQQGLSPAIACTITSGRAGATGCTADYPSGTSLILSATASTGHTFEGWGGICEASGSAASCSLTVSQSMAASATFTQVGGLAPEATVGKWDPPFATPIIAIHSALLSSGRVLLWGLNGEPWLWDPSSYPASPGSGFAEVSAPSEMFCSGHTFLPDGRLIVVGGEIAALGNGYGIPDVNIFAGTAWSTAPPMHFARWYPTATTLPDGEIVALSGSDETTATVSVPEVYDGTSWRQLPGASLKLPLYPRVFVEPKLGRLFYAGENPISRYLDPDANGGAGAWISAGTRQSADGRGYGSAVMLDGKVLYVGGGGGACPSLPNSSAEIIDLNAGTPTWRSVGSMAYRRRQINATILADGRVLVTGGTSACGFDEPSGSIFAAELWDPATEQWTLMASGSIRRIYHSTALLLPDARVLVAGGNDQSTAEVFTPPYLYASDGSPAHRPAYALSTVSAGYGQALMVQSADAATIAKVTLIRLGAATHAFNESQQLITIAFTAATDGQSLTVTMPASGKRAPPGPYMLFILNGQGVPSIAQIVTLR